MDGEPPGDGLVEIELEPIEGVDSGVEGGGVDGSVASGSGPWALLLVVVTITATLALLGLLGSDPVRDLPDDGTDGGDEVSTPEPSRAGPRTPASTDPPPPSVEAVGPPALRPQEGTADLDGQLAVLSTSGDLVDRLWLFPADEPTLALGVPFVAAPGPHPLLFAGDALAFTATAPEDLVGVTAFTVQVFGRRPTSLIEQVPGARPGDVWIISDGGAGPSSATLLVAGVPFPTGALEGIELVAAGALDGLLVTPADRDTFGPIAYWSPGGGLAELDGVPRSWVRVLTASGDLAAVEQSGRVAVIDLVEGRIITQFSHSSSVASACFSPAGDYLAMVLDERERNLLVLQFEPYVSGSELELAGGPVQSVTWTGPRELVAASPSELVVIDPTRNRRSPVASLSGPGEWRLVSDRATC